MPPPSTAPSVASYATAYSPVMTTAGFMPQYAFYPPGMQPTPRGSMEPSTATAYQHLRDLTYANGNGFFAPQNGHHNGHNGHHKGMMSPPEHPVEEPIELLQRIQDAIPDINRLLGSYRNTKSKLQAREAEFQQMKTQHEQDLMHKDFYIEALQTQMRKTANEAAEESTKLKNTINELRMELGNLDEKRKDLEEKLEESERSNEELTRNKHDLEEEVRTLNTSMKEAQEAHEKECERREQEKVDALATQKREMTESFEEIKAEDEKAAAEALAAREKELLDQQEAMKNDYEDQKRQMQEAHDTLQSNFDDKVNELDSTKTDLENKHKELEETRVQHANEVELLNNTHADHVADMERRWADERGELEQRITDKCDELAHCEREKQKVEEDNVVKEQQLQAASDGMRLTIDNLGKDCDRLRKTLHSLGEATDLKSTKGDPFL